MSAVAKTMSAVLLLGNGGFGQLEYRENVAVPVPSADEVLIRVNAAGVNNTDINTRTAWYSKSVSQATADGGAEGFSAARTEDSGWTGALPSFPRIQGADACGHIVAMGASVDPRRLGERVLIEPLFRPTPGRPLSEARYFGSECDGAFAQFALAPAVHAHAIESRLSDAELASFPCAYGAAENMIARSGVASGERVLVTGASGGVGSAAVQLARRRGAQVIALADPAKAAAIEALGAARVLPRGADLLVELGRESIDVVIDVVGGAQFPALLEVLRRGGRYACAGAIAGPIVSLDLRTLYLKDLRLLGCTMLGESVFPDLIGYIERGEVQPLLAAIFPLREIVAAQQAFLQKRHTGKIVLLPPAD